MTAPSYVYDLLASETMARWNGGAALGSPVTITYSFPTTQPASINYPNYAGFTATEIGAARSALAYISSFTNLNFVEVGSGGALSFGNGDVGAGFSGRATYAYNGSGIYQGTVVMSNTGSGSVAASDFAPGSITSNDVGGHGWGTLLHEIGHALGLKHPFDTNIAGDSASVMPAQTDNLSYTIMSYTPYQHSNVAIVTSNGGGGFSYTYSNLSPVGYSLYDIAALQYLYGADPGTGNRTYAFHSDQPTYVTATDRGANNTIDCSDLTGANRIDMRAGTFSDLAIAQDLPPGVNIPNRYDGSSALAVAYGARIDNCVGGSGVDNITGNNFANRIDGGLGADVMRGAGADDTYIVDNAGDKVIEAANAGYDTVHTTLASYTLTANVERLYFDNAIAHVGRGNDLANRLYGGGGDDRFVVDAGGGDTFSGGNGVDVFDGRSSATGMVLRLDNQALNGGSVAGDLFGGVERFTGSNTAGDAMTMSSTGRAYFVGNGGNDTLTGGTNVDALYGGDGADRLFGLAGKDALQGGTGNDTMTGGADRDYFQFVESNFGADTITDWQDGVDLLKVLTSVADSFSDFSVAGNGTHHVVLTLSPGNSITLDSGVNITINASDFLFY